MNTQTFSIKGVFRDSWSMMKKEFWKYVLVGLILMAVSFVASIFEESNIVYALVSFLLQIYLGLVWLLFSVRSVQKGELVFKDIFAEINPKIYIKFFLLSLLVSLVVMLGFVLLIIPGVLFAIAYQFSGYFMVDGELGVRAAMKKSWRATKGLRWKLFWLSLLVGLLNILGLAVVGVGLFVTVPLTSLVLGHVYVNVIKKRNITEPVSS
jgi:uncharacterized membrane protein